MKTFRWIMIMIAAVVFVAGATSMSWSERKMHPAGEPKATTQTTKPAITKAEDVIKVDEIKKEVARTCPPGWHVGSVSAYGWSCEPNLPATNQCPVGYIWRKTGECEYICESVDKQK